MRRTLTVSTALLAILAVAAVQKPKQASEKHEHLATVKTEQALDNAIQSLRIETRAGDIEVEQAKGDKLQITADVRVDRKRAAEITDPNDFAQHVRISTKDKVLTIADAHKDAEDRDAWRVSLKVAVPRALAIDAAAGAGNVIVNFAAGDIKLKTGAGNIELAIDTAALVSATSGAGNVKLVLGEVSGPVEAKSGAGDVELRLAKGGSEKKVALRSGAGNVSLALPGEASGQFDLSTGVGSISTEGCEGIKVKKHAVGARASGSLGEGGPAYELTTGVGSIQVSRKQ